MKPPELIALFLAIFFIGMAPAKYPCPANQTATYQPANGIYELTCTP